MSCPDWRSLCRRRESATGDALEGRVADDAPEGRVADDALEGRVTYDAPKGRVTDDALEWHSALRHLDRCPACQAAAPAFDPTLLFRRLPALEAGRDDVAAMKQAVAGMRRGQTIEHRRSSLARPWLRAAAVAAVLLGSLVLRGAGVGPIAPAASGAPAAPASLAPQAAASEIDLWRMPLIETADPIYGSIIQVVDDDISLVLVVALEVDV